MWVRLWLPPTTTGTRDYINSSVVGLRVDGGGEYALGGSAKRVTGESSASYMEYYHELINGISRQTNKVSSNPNLTGTVESVSTGYPQAYYAKCFNAFYVRQYSNTQTLIPSGTHMMIYGIRYDD